MTGLLLLGVGMTFMVSRILSATVLRGAPASFVLELPPYRVPQVGRVIIRSVLDRTLYVLMRAVSVAAPAGILIWIAANITIGEQSILLHLAEFLDPLGRFMGMDGMILTAFILGLPANEIVMPLMLTGYLGAGTLMDAGGIAAMGEVFLQNGWTWITAVNVMLFSLMHWPCSTTILTIKKETGSLWQTVGAVLLPTACGFAACTVFTAFARLFV